MKKRGNFFEVVPPAHPARLASLAHFFNSKKNIFKKNKCGIISDYLPWLLIGLVVLALVMIFIFSLKSEGVGLIDKIKNLMRIG